MRNKLMQAAGVFAVSSFVLVGVVAWFQVGQRLEITIQPAQEPRGAAPDPLALLHDDLDALRTELATLRSGLERGLGGLANQLDDAAAERHQAAQRKLASMATRLDALETRLGRPQPKPELIARLDRLDRRLDGLARIEGRVAQLSAASPWAARAPAPDTPTRPAPVVPEAPATRPRDPEPATPEPADPEPAASQPAVSPRAATPVDPEPTPAARPRRRFLSFALPGDRFAFDKPQRFELIPSLSRVGFDAKSTLHDFSGVTSKVSGALRTNLAHPDAGCSGQVDVVAATLVTGVEGRDRAMRDHHLEVKRHPRLRFLIQSFAQPKVDARAMTLSGVVVGQLTIHGVTRQIRMPVKAAVDRSRRLLVEGQVPIKLSDFKIEIPSQAGVIGMEDQLSIWIALRARRVAR